MCSLVRLGILLLLWNIVSIVSGVVSSGDTISGSTKKIDSMMETQEKLLKAQIEIIRINTLATESLDVIKTRLSLLEEEFKKLNELTDVRREHINGSCKVATELLMNHYSSIDSQLKSLQMTVAERSQVDEKKGVIKDIVETIKRGQFKLADEKIIQLGDPTQIPMIVHEVYANSEENLELLVSLSKALSSITPSYYVLKSLREEMQRNGHQDPNKLIILVDALDSEVMKQHNDPNEIKAEAIAIIDELVDLITATSTEFLTHAMKVNCYVSNTAVHALAKALYDFRPEVSDNVMKLVVNSTYGTVESNTILTNLYSHSNVAQAISGINELFWSLKEDDKLNTSVIINLASNLSKLKAKQEYVNLSKVRRDAVDEVIEHIPTCARNLFFMPSVCLWNKSRKTNLIAASSMLQYDSNRRNIFTWTPAKNESKCNNQTSGASWFVDKVGDKIFFKSNEFTNEYLYVAAIDYSPEMRYVFNWVPGHNTDDQSAFNVELDGDYCRLKSVYFNEYLFASEVKFSNASNYSYVFTWKPGTSGGNSDFVWQIRSC